MRHNLKLPDLPFVAPKTAVASAPSIDPTSFGGLSIWWKADFASLTDGTVIGDGTNNWTDSSGNGHTASQATSAKRPVYKTNIIGSMPGILFTGASSSNLLFPSLTISRPLTIIGVAKLNTSIDTYLLGSNAANVQVRRGTSGANVISIFDDGAGGNQSDVFGSAITATVMMVWKRDLAVDLLEFRENKTVRKTGQPQVNTITVNQMGGSDATTGGSNYWNGYMFEIVVYSGNCLTGAQCDSLYDSYFKPRWALP